ncbi:MAG: zinc metalloprotease HtpX [Alphaproteobacteria bacterium]|nr:zinc metalloprotease HtpX [Alphaproteobacteria bacterium]
MSKTVLLMVAMMLLFMYVGNALGGEQGMQTAFLAAAGMNFFSYFFSDKLVLKQYNATEVTAQTEPQLYQIVQRLANKAGLPMPKVYIIPEQVPNAFATGRNPSHAAVAATQGLLNMMTPQEVEGVLAHEMSHVKHHDILIGTVAAVFAGAIAMLANMTRGTASQQNSGQRNNCVFAAVLLPIAATVIRMTISRTREYKADEGAAYLTAHPEWLMSALSKLDGYSRQYQMQRATSQTAHMFIMNPFNGIKGLTQLFATHPSTEDRLKALAQIQQKLH